MQLHKKYLTQKEFCSLNDFLTNFKIEVPDNFNFSYDVVDEYARIEPEKIAIVWTNDEGEHRELS